MNKWFNLYKDEFNKDYMLDLSKKISLERLHKKIYPPKNLVFNAFKQCSYDDLKVVIIGQDPYHGKDQANGLAFSTNGDAIVVPPSLRIIFKAIEESVYDGLKLDQNSDLTRWSNQGILLLNRILTVEEGKPKSHSGYGWEIFTNFVIKQINDKFNNIKFLLMGTEAQVLSKFISKSNHTIFCTEHPAASIYAGREWKYNNVFLEINKSLLLDYKKAIIW